MNGFRSIVLGMMTIGMLSLISTSTAYAEKPVNLKVAVVHASTSAGQVGKGISKRMAKSLKTAFGRFKSFRLISKDVLKLNKGKKSVLELPTNEQAVIIYDGKAKRKHKLTLSIPKHKVKMKLSAPAKKLFYQAGIRHDKGILILAFYLKE
jgi:hypothetical protein